LPWETLASAAGWLLAAGALLGIPTGVLYHLALYRALRGIDALPDDWF
jgi:hypothetical protein